MQGPVGGGGGGGGAAGGVRLEQGPRPGVCPSPMSRSGVTLTPGVVVAAVEVAVAVAPPEGVRLERAPGQAYRRAFRDPG